MYVCSTQASPKCLVLMYGEKLSGWKYWAGEKNTDKIWSFWCSNQPQCIDKFWLRIRYQIISSKLERETKNHSRWKDSFSLSNINQNQISKYVDILIASATITKNNNKYYACFYRWNRTVRTLAFSYHFICHRHLSAVFW